MAEYVTETEIREPSSSGWWLLFMVGLISIAVGVVVLPVLLQPLVRGAASITEGYQAAAESASDAPDRVSAIAGVRREGAMATSIDRDDT